MEIELIEKVDCQFDWILLDWAQDCCFELLIIKSTAEPTRFFTFRSRARERLSLGQTKSFGHFVCHDIGDGKRRSGCWRRSISHMKHAFAN